SSSYTYFCSCVLFSPPPLYLCFFSCSGPPRHLHSFPTRRSSDLLAFPGDEVDATQRPHGRLALAPAQGMADAPQASDPMTGIVGVDGVADLNVLRDDVGLFELRVDHSSPPLARRTGIRR